MRGAGSTGCHPARVWHVLSWMWKTAQKVTEGEQQRSRWGTRRAGVTGAGRRPGARSAGQRLLEGGRKRVPPGCWPGEELSLEQQEWGEAAVDGGEGRSERLLQGCFLYDKVLE